MTMMNTKEPMRKALSIIKLKKILIKVLNKSLHFSLMTY